MSNHYVAGEVIANAKVDVFMKSTGVQNFIEEFVGGGELGLARFEQILLGLGHTMFVDGLTRSGVAQEINSDSNQAAVLIKQVEIFSSGAAEMQAYIRGE